MNRNSKPYLIHDSEVFRIHRKRSFTRRRKRNSVDRVRSSTALSRRLHQSARRRWPALRVPDIYNEASRHCKARKRFAKPANRIGREVDRVIRRVPKPVNAKVLNVGCASWNIYSLMPPPPDGRRRSPPNLYRYGHRADRCPWRWWNPGGAEVSFLSVTQTLR
jgi:hypothetical protein